MAQTLTSEPSGLSRAHPAERPLTRRARALWCVSLVAAVGLAPANAPASGFRGGAIGHGAVEHGALDHSPAPALVRSYVISDFEVDLQVLRSGALVVTETVAVRFSGSYNGIYRTIPVAYRSPQGFNFSLRLRLLNVTDAAGHPLRHQERRTGDSRTIKVWVPDARDATRTIVFRYRVENGIRFMRQGEEEWDELYWNVTGTAWPVAIERAHARIRLPALVSGVRARAFTGSYRSSARDADIRIGKALVEVEARHPLGIHEGLTVAIAWDSRLRVPGATEGAAGPSTGEYLIHRPGRLAKVAAFLRSNWPLLIPVLVFLFMLQLWRRSGQDPKRRPIAPRYEPPEGMTPSEAGVLIDNRPDMRDITAMLVDLAVRGHLKIEETEEERFLGLSSKREYAFVRLTDPAAWTTLKGHERKLLEAVFSDGDRQRATTSDLANSFYRELPGIRDRIFDELVAQRYYVRRPDRVQQQYVAIGAISAVVGIALGMMFSARFGLSPLPVILGGVLSGLIIIGFGLIMPARTIAGTRALEQILGLEEFLTRVESDRFKRMITGPEMFEKLLPYAMALGVEKTWAAAFKDTFTEPPQWYSGVQPGGFQTLLFVNSMSQMSGQAATAMAAAPRSSGGSGFAGGGFSGGGFSGGGFGGGGGGAF